MKDENSENLVFEDDSDSGENFEDLLNKDDSDLFKQTKKTHTMDSTNSPRMEVVKSDSPKKQKIDLGIAGMDEMMLQQFISSILPKLEPAIKKASGALSEYLGDNEKIIVLRQIKKGGDPMVIILSNKKKFNVTGESFTADSDAVEQVFNVTEFISKIFSGEFTK